MVKIGRYSLILGLLISALGFVAEKVSNPFPQVASSYLVKINDRIVWTHNPYLKLPPASLTKIMTALIVLENANLDEVVTISKKAANETGTRIGLKVGDKMRVKDLLATCIIYSANDASYALAEYVGKSEKGFVKIMNLKAKKLGLKNTHFTNPCGHDQKGLYSTAEDLALLSETSLKNKVFADLISFTRGKITTIDGKRTFKIENSNQLIGRYPGAIGVKSGYTKKAGKCVIALVEREKTKVLLVLLNAPNRWWDAVMILDRAFASQNK